jgi:hypothetical protein
MASPVCQAPGWGSLGPLATCLVLTNSAPTSAAKGPQRPLSHLSGVPGVSTAPHLPVHSLDGITPWLSSPPQGLTQHQCLAPQCTTPHPVPRHGLPRAMVMPGSMVLPSAPGPFPHRAWAEQGLKMAKALMLGMKLTNQ